MLRAHGQTEHRGRAKAPKAGRPPTTHIATGPRQVWCRDMTYLPATVIGQWFHLYLILDLYSRKIVGWEVHDSDDSIHAAHLVRRTSLAEGIATLPIKPVLHGDNGTTLKATLQAQYASATMQEYSASGLVSRQFCKRWCGTGAEQHRSS